MIAIIFSFSFFFNTILFLFFSSFIALPSLQILKIREKEEEKNSSVVTFFENRNLYLLSFIIIFFVSFIIYIFSFFKIVSILSTNFLVVSFLLFFSIYFQLIVCSLFSANFSEKVFPTTLKILLFFSYLILPLSYPPFFLIEKIKPKESEEASDEEIKAFIDEGEREGIFEMPESELIKGIIEFSDTIVREVMTPRIDMVLIESSTKLKEAIKIFAESRHTRLPVYEKQIDNIIGAVFVKDVLNPAISENSESPVKDFAKPVPFVPENKPISQLLKEFQINKEQLAIVVDEYGGVDGLVTTEDLVEEIVGEIEEKGEKEEQLIKILDEETFEVKGRTSLKDLEEVLNCDIPEGDYDSVAGWIVTRIGSVPQLETTYKIDSLFVKIVSSDKKRIHKVIIKKVKGENNGKSDR